MKKLLIATALLMTNFVMAQDINLQLPDLPVFQVPFDATKEISIACTSRGTGLVPLTITFNSEEKISELASGVITAQGQNFYKFDVKVSDLEVLEDQLRFNFKGTNIEGSYEVNLTDGKPAGAGNIDLTTRPSVGATVFDKYPLNGCRGKLQ